MKEKNYSPYGTFSFNKITAPKGKPRNDRQEAKTVGKGDLRVKDGK